MPGARKPPFCLSIFFHPSIEKEFFFEKISWATAYILCFFSSHNPSSDSLITSIRLFAISTLSFSPKAVSIPLSLFPSSHRASWAIRTLVSRPGGKFKEGGKKKRKKTSSTLHIQSPADIPFSFPNVFPKLLIKWPPSISYRYCRVVKTKETGEKDIRQKETSLYFYFMADLCRALKISKKHRSFVWKRPK